MPNKNGLVLAKNLQETDVLRAFANLRHPIGAKSLVNAKPVNAEALKNGFELVVMQL